MALMSRSAALNFGDDSVCSAGPVSGVDQRGITRPQGAHCDTGAFEASLIMGQKFNDLNGNGVKDGSESGLPGWTIQLKNTSNAILDSTTTNSTGNYTLTVPTLPFTYRVREVLQAGWHQTTPNPADIPLSILTPGVSGINFGNNLVANLTITKIARRVSNSSNIRFTINVINSGPADATKVIVTDPLANKLQFVSANTDKGSCTFASPTVTCSLGKLKSGNGAKITIVVTPKTAGLQPHNCATATTTSVQDDPNKQVLCRRHHSLATKKRTSKPNLRGSLLPASLVPATPALHSHHPTLYPFQGEERSEVSLSRSLSTHAIQLPLLGKERVDE